MTEKAIVLLSGGIDSATCLAYTRSLGMECFALSFQYGQRHSFELEAARAVAKSIGVQDHRIAEIDMSVFASTSSLVNQGIGVPKMRPEQDRTHGATPVTYVPARNTIFLSYALAWAETEGAKSIVIGVNNNTETASNRYPDCRPGYIYAYQAMATLAFDHKPISILTPLLHLTKAEIIRWGLDLGVDYALTSSCYDPDLEGRPCGGCDACLARLEGFRLNGIEDPVRYAGTQGVKVNG